MEQTQTGSTTNTCPSGVFQDDYLPFDTFQDNPEIQQTLETKPEEVQDVSTEEEDDDDIRITLSNVTSANNIPEQTATLKAPKPAVVLTPAFTNPLLKPNYLDDAHLVTNYPIFEYDIEKGEKPWKKPGADISDYFNYGFNEETWKIYCEKQRKLRIETASMRRMMGDPQLPVEGMDIDDGTARKDMPCPVGAPVPFALPPGMPLNLPPEMANSIASMVASQLGLPQSFLSQLPPLPALISAGMNPQALFPGFYPSMGIPPTGAPPMCVPPAGIPVTDQPNASLPPSNIPYIPEMSSQKIERVTPEIDKPSTTEDLKVSSPRGVFKSKTKRSSNRIREISRDRDRSRGLSRDRDRDRSRGLSRERMRTRSRRSRSRSKERYNRERRAR
ncbi:Pre-mRNA 3'-end-processing factor FIP1 [Thelohanellus kitauei]|uniref:Pre-mRNA 3'-end-processing factor FIP1 n=1 Tax=Thelohanellus kitauei TaxID=669202 RepID=A0A0C2J1Z8_THEKT|nr:Pre-mRNA 3'-end-processing factor FIP1 [Thelohanellus kitauei]